MSVDRPRGLRGFAADLLHVGVPGLHHAGEGRAPVTWVIRPHQHPVWELYYQVSGPATHWRVEERELAVAAGALLAVQPRTEHAMAMAAEEPYHFYYAAIDAEALLGDEPDVLEVWRRRHSHLVADAGTIVPPFQAFLSEVTTSQPFRRSGLRHTAVRLMVEAARLFGAGRRRRSLALHPAVARAQRILEQDVEAALSLPELARRVDLSPAYLTQLFVRQVGEGPVRYRLRARVERALLLLGETDLSITEIAAELGFSSPQHFATVFRHQIGATPRSWRRLHGDPAGRAAALQPRQGRC
ncbi:MAG TPA: AraC family transcriptional regulator [Candidatus Dormibacteraeota bacterium]|jgi:AraC-like DNA-binding protein|nr:AraC family transcriptional regulator [Candidatus Dormibacteraeota bacterium]